MHQIPFWFFHRGITPEREITWTRKKMCVSYFSMRNPYIKLQNTSMHVSWWTDRQMHARMDAQPETNNPRQLLRSWGHNYPLIITKYPPYLFHWYYDYYYERAVWSGSILFAILSASFETLLYLWENHILFKFYNNYSKFFQVSKIVWDLQ